MPSCYTCRHRIYLTLMCGLRGNPYGDCNLLPRHICPRWKLHNPLDLPKVNEVVNSWGGLLRKAEEKRRREEETVPSFQTFR